ncbi:MAG: hypothetical protein ACQEW8_07945 [Actinomycetota bacterium]
MDTTTSTAERASGATIWRLFLRRWPAAAGFAGMVALVPASIVGLTVPGRLDFLSIAGTLGVWFFGAGAFGGTAIALQHAFRQPRVVAPLFAAGIVLLLGGILWVSIRLLEPTSYALYTLAVIAPFVLVLVVTVTLAAVLLPARYRIRASIAAAVVSAAVSVVSILI